jgi:hypothetical protein
LTLGKETMGRKKPADPKRSEHVSAAAHHSRSASQFMLLFACAVAAALGVPASVIFEGKFSSNSMSQCAASSILAHASASRRSCNFFAHRLQLLNSTVTSLALAVNKVLTACYHVYAAAPAP